MAVSQYDTKYVTFELHSYVDTASGILRGWVVQNLEPARS